MKRVAVFAHFDKNNKILDYVVNYLENLKKIADKIVFVSDSNIEQNELNKISEFVCYINAKRHGEYDFGSYKRGFIYLKENNILENCDELIFANDSCYAPIIPFREMFDKMSSKPVDFWGITANYSRVQHIQSYFLAFKPNVFNSKVFEDFILSVQAEADKNNVVRKYEIGLSEILTKAGFKYDVYCELSKEHYSMENDRYDKLIIQDKCPFLKRRTVLFKEWKRKYPLGIKKLIQNKTNYNYRLIEQDLLANKEKLTFKQHVVGIIFAFRKRIFKFKSNKRYFMLFGFWVKY